MDEKDAKKSSKPPSPKKRSKRSDSRKSNKEQSSPRSHSSRERIKRVKESQANYEIKHKPKAHKKELHKTQSSACLAEPDVSSCPPVVANDDTAQPNPLPTAAPSFKNPDKEPAVSNTPEKTADHPVETNLAPAASDNQTAPNKTGRKVLEKGADSNADAQKKS